MGMEWTGTIITGWQGSPKLAVMRLWTSKAHGLRNEVVEEVAKEPRNVPPYKGRMSKPLS
jgi:hypothetical protein